MRIWTDVEDLYQYVGGNARPSGIQRLAFELQRALRARLGDDVVRFVRHNQRRDGFVVVTWSEVEALFAALTGPLLVRSSAAVDLVPRPPRPFYVWLKRLQYRLPNALRIPLVNAMRAQRAALRAQLGAFRAEFAALRALFAALLPRHRVVPPEAEVEPPVPFETLAANGDTFAILGSPWFRGYAELIAAVKQRHGLQVLILVYDLIPLRRPEWCDAYVVQTFRLWMETTLPLADHVMAISHASAADVTRYMGELGMTLPGGVRAIPIGSGFKAAEQHAPAAVRDDLPPPGSYVLFVSTIEARKNHQLLVQVWRRLLDDMPIDAVPTLVFAGHIGWMVQDLMQQLRNADFMGGKIRIIEDPSDTELTQLYRGCLFTVFASFYEGWGLPVTESLAFGKPCVISNTTSLPEAGGALARYFDPYDVNDAARVIRATFVDREGLAAWEAQIVAAFRPVSWDESAVAVMAALT
jgi:glycosyltransferase involved in cell wall biosynthesis